MSKLVRDSVKDEIRAMSEKEHRRLHHCNLELPTCHMCGKPSKGICTKTPAGGWGSIKCGRTLCSECECDCQEPTL